MESKYLIEVSNYQTIAYCPLKKHGFQPENGAELFVKRIPKNIHISELLTHFGCVGEIFQIRLMMSENINENRGYAYVTYMNASMARNAIKELNCKPLNGSSLNVETSLDNKRIFMGGIPINKSKDEVRQINYLGC